MKNPTLLRSMPDDGGADSDGKTERKRVSKRAFLTVNGGEAERMEDASGARYTLLGSGGGDYDYTFGEDSAADKMFAIFGFHTKIGNVANTVLNDKEDPGSTHDASVVIEEFIALTKAGKWAERAVGAPGSRVDKDALAAAVVEVAQAKGQTKNESAVRAKLEDDIGLVRKLRANPEIRAAYDKRVGKAPATTEDALALV